VLVTLRSPFVINGVRLNVAVSIGIAQRHTATADAAELLREADFAMYMATAGGRSRYRLFDPQLHDEKVGRTSLKADLASAAANGQLRLAYQPVADLRTGEVVGVEALVRWQHPTLGLLAPDDFIHLAEETGDIGTIGTWVLQTATQQMATWRQGMDHCADLWVAVNLASPHSVPWPSFLSTSSRSTAPSCPIGQPRRQAQCSKPTSRPARGIGH